MTERIIQELTKALIEEFIKDLKTLPLVQPHPIIEKWEKRLTKK